MKKVKVIRGLDNLLKNRDGYTDCLGVRFDNDLQEKQLWEKLPPSLDLCEDSDTYLQELDGTCAIYLHARGCGYWDTQEYALQEIEEAVNANIFRYSHEHVYIIGGDGEHQGDDPYETVISNAVVLAEVEITEE